MDKQGRWFDLGILLTGLLLGFLSLWVGSGEAIWQYLDIPKAQQAPLTGALSIMFLLAGFLIATYQQVDKLRQAVDGQTRELARELAARGSSSSLRSLSSDAALQEITTLLPSTARVWNTRIAAQGLDEYYPTAAGRAFDAALQRSVTARRVHYREVLSQQWEGHVAAWLSRKAPRNAGGGGASFSVLELDVPSFVNFIVLELGDGSKQIYFGWAISRQRGFEQSCLHISDARAADYYVSWHNELFASGRAVNVPPPG